MLIIKQATKVWKTRENAELVKITHHRGELICTPDHEIYTTNRGWVKAKDLKPKDRLNGLGRSMKDEKHCCVKLTSDNRYYAEHRFIAGYFEDIAKKYQVSRHLVQQINSGESNLVCDLIFPLRKSAKKVAKTARKVLMRIICEIKSVSR